MSEKAVTFKGSKEYYRTVTMVDVPRIGDEVHIDGIYGKVTGITWNVNNLPMGKAVTVFFKEKE